LNKKNRLKIQKKTPEVLVPAFGNSIKYFLWNESNRTCGTGNSTGRRTDGTGRSTGGWNEGVTEESIVGLFSFCLFLSLVERIGAFDLRGI